MILHAYLKAAGTCALGDSHMPAIPSTRIVWARIAAR